MEELQDAIEDAQFMNAVHDESPKPSKPWRFMEKPDLHSYIEKMRVISPQMLTLKAICATPTGFSLVSFGYCGCCLTHCVNVIENDDCVCFPCSLQSMPGFENLPLWLIFSWTVRNIAPVVSKRDSKVL